MIKKILYFIGIVVACIVSSLLTIHFMPSNEIKYVDTTSIKDVVSKMYDSVFLIENYNDGKLVSTGTGFAYKNIDGKTIIITNNHVVASSPNIKVRATDDTVYDATLIGGDLYSDVALISIDKEYVAIPLGKVADMSIGDVVFTVGSPLGNQYVGTVTKGILSGKDRLVNVSLKDGEIMMNVLQTDAAINEGNSGGPLCNLDGEVIGINTLKLAGDSTEGMGFAIPIDEAIRVAEIILKDGKIVRPSLGVSLTDTDSYVLYGYGLVPNKESDGAVILKTSSEGIAFKAGLQKGDVIIALNDEKVKSAAHFRYLLYKYNIGDKITIRVLRLNQEKTYELTLLEALND